MTYMKYDFSHLSMLISMNQYLVMCVQSANVAGMFWFQFVQTNIRSLILLWRNTLGNYERLEGGFN